MKYKNFGAVAVVLAAVLWSMDGLLRRQLFDLPSTVVVFWEHLLGFMFLLPIVLFVGKNFKKLSGKQWGAIALVSLLSGALGTVFYTTALMKVNFIPFSVVVLLQQLQPLFAVLAAFFLLREPITKYFITAAPLALVAAYFVSFPDLKVNFATGKETVYAILFALGAAAAWGISTAYSKYALKGTSFLQITAIRFGITPIFAFLFLPFLGQTDQITNVNPNQWMYILAIVFSTGLVALAVYYFGLQRVPASRSTFLELAWPVSAVLVGTFFLNETLTSTQWLGAIVLVLSMIAIARDSKRVELATPLK
ncbi:MAG: EamA family transporter [bacterium]